MKGLILKDLLLVKSNSRILGIILIMFIIFSLNSPSLILTILPLMSVMFCTSTFSYDEFNHFEFYATTLNLTKRRIVASKYLFTIIMIIISLVISLLLTYIGTFVQPTIKDSVTFETLFGGMIGTILVISIMYPLLYKWGSNKGRIFLFIFFFGISLLIGFILKFVHISITKEQLLFLNNFGIYIITTLAILLFTISYFISARIYQKKDL